MSQVLYFWPNRSKYVLMSNFLGLYSYCIQSCPKPPLCFFPTVYRMKAPFYFYNSCDEQNAASPKRNKILTQNLVESLKKCLYQGSNQLTFQAQCLIFPSDCTVCAISRLWLSSVARKSLIRSSCLNVN